ncbi:MAG: undecaprenyl/decaprenyl-phosphate alpha-N-acetylglucosaminyl 1-phosphate transferase [Chloroflexi bacterium]|nr:undecaprenyl/decaprenyl-phosphate alpha-N-acetylglucosaminyl 1-phosphate transferase [Chloroflexota bacterium]
MTAPLGAYALIFGLAFGLALIVTPLAIRLGNQQGLIAEPGGRRKHGRPVVQTGAIPIYVAFVGSVLVSQLLVVNGPASSEGFASWFQVMRFDPKEVIRLSGLLLGGTVIFVIGLIDDRYELPPVTLYVSQIFAGAIAIAFLIIIESINNPLTGLQTDRFPYIVTVTATLFWLGLMINTVNWLDGADGLATGVTAIACLILFIHAAFQLNPPQHSVAILPVALLGATLGFLPFNFAPARIFLGSGAHLLGFFLGVLSIIGGAKMASILLVMGLPLLDVAWQIVRRLSEGKNPAFGDRGHLHFRLEELGLSHQQIAWGYYVFCASFGALALLIPSRLYKLIALGVMALIALIGFLWLARQTPQPYEEGDEH